MSPSPAQSAAAPINPPQPSPPGDVFNLQVAGHGDIVRSRAGHLLKPSSDKERAFYDRLAASPTAFRWLRPFIPRYYGNSHLLQHGNEKPFIKLQDLTAKLARPCVLDVKLGARQWDDDASPTKICKLRARAAATTSAACGIRFAGMRRETPDGCVDTTGRDTTTALTEADLLPALRWFLHNGANVRVSVARKAARLIREFIALVEKQTDFLFYGTSLLVLYDGRAAEHGDDGASTVNVMLIDFAHTVDAHCETDENTLFGLRYLLQLFEKISETDGHATLPDRRC